jgi:predicted Rossmann fold flavoprotein
LLLDGDRHVHLAGVSHPASVRMRINGRTVRVLDGAWLWTHFGASGPLALNLSRHWHRAQEEHASVEVSLSLCPGETFESLDAWWLQQERDRPRARLPTVLATRLPAAVADAWIGAAGIPHETTMARLGREERRTLVRSLVAMPMAIRGSRGYGYAEVTAGGVPLEEVHSATMQSRLCPGLYLVGEMLDVDGRLGGFNFQWAWSSAWVAGQAIARAMHMSRAVR